MREITWWSNWCPTHDRHAHNTRESALLCGRLLRRSLTNLYLYKVVTDSKTGKMMYEGEETIYERDLSGALTD